MRLLIQFCLLLVLCLSSAFANKIYKAEHFTLENGLQVYILKRQKAPVVVSRMYHLTGSNHEKPGKTGLAHYLEHLCFHDTSNEITFDDVQKIPTFHNAATTDEYTYFMHDVPSYELETILRFEAGLMQSLALNDSDFEMEKNVVLNELAESLSDAETIAAERMNRTFFMGTPFARPTIGEPKEIPHLTKEDAIAFHNARYAPNRAILVLGGDIDRAQVEPLVKKYFGQIPIKDIPETKIQFNRTIKKNERLDPLVMDQVTHPKIMRRFPVTATSSKDQLKKEIIFNLLQKSDLKLAVNFRIVHGYGYLGLSKYLKSPESSKEKLKEEEKSFKKSIKKLARKGIKKKDLESAKNRIRTAYLYTVDDITQCVDVLGSDLAQGKSLKDAEHYLDILNNITKKEVNKVLKEILETDKHLTSWLLPSKKSPKGHDDEEIN